MKFWLFVNISKYDVRTKNALIIIFAHETYASGLINDDVGSKLALCSAE